MVLIYNSLLTNGTEQIFTILFKGIAMQILYLLPNWVICLFIVEWCEFFLAIFEILGRNSLPGKSFSLPSILSWSCHMSSTMQGRRCSIIHSTLPPQPILPLATPSYRPQTSLLPSSEPTCSLSKFPESRKHGTGVLDCHHRVSKTHAEQGTISCFVRLDHHSHRHNCLSPCCYCI